MKLMQYAMGTVLTGCFLLSTNTSAAVDNWTQYMSTSRNDTPVWAHTLRSSFSSRNLDSLVSQGDVIGTIGGPNVFDDSLGSGDAALAAYMQRLQQGGLASYQASVYAAALDAIAFEQATGNTVYWLLGNEINSRAHSRSWDPYAVGTQTGKANDQTYIPAFAEYFLAPIIETILRVEADTGTDIHLMMGSIANGSGSSQRAWATTLLNYTFVGTYAPSLAGKRVYELMEHLAFHYSITDDNWQDTLDFYYDWKGTGAVRSIMDTEEIGNQAMDRGAGPYQALLGFSRLMTWVTAHDLSAEEVRLNYWSEGQGYADEAMSLLQGYLGETKLTKLTSPTVTATGTTESYAFETADGKRVVLVFAGMSSSATLTNVQLTVPGSTVAASGTLHVFTPSTTSAGLTTTSIAPTLSTTAATLNVNMTLPAEGVAMFLLPKAQTTTIPPTTTCTKRRRGCI